MIAPASPLSDDTRDYLRALGAIAVAPLVTALGRIAYRVAREEHRAWLHRRMAAWEQKSNTGPQS